MHIHSWLVGVGDGMGFHVAVQRSGDLVSHVCNPENLPACLQAASCFPQPAVLGDLDTNLRGRTAIQLSAFHICKDATRNITHKLSSLQSVMFLMGIVSTDKCNCNIET